MHSVRKQSSNHMALVKKHLILLRSILTCIIIATVVVSCCIDHKCLKGSMTRYVYALFVRSLLPALFLASVAGIFSLPD
jgi:hypothetical protein